MRAVLTGPSGRGRRTNSPMRSRLAATSWGHKQPKTRPRFGIKKPGRSAVLCVTLALVYISVHLLGQQSGPPPASPVNGGTHATHVLGLEHLKRGAEGRLMVVNKTLLFKSGASTTKISIPSTQDVFTGEESQELVRGKTGFLVELAMPYESSRVVSLLASRKIDILTLEYRDSNGGLHGAIFTLRKGEAPRIMRLLVDQGADAGVVPGVTARP
jgi:hypothetical protein